MKIDVRFNGRKTGSIGIDYEIKEELDVEKNITLEQLTLKLYEKYEHIKLDKRDVFLKGTNDRLFVDIKACKTCFENNIQGQKICKNCGSTL